MLKIFPSFFLLLVLTIGCSSKPVPSFEPLWLNKPNINGKTGSVGSSKPQFKGQAVQRKVAISRAIDELAQQSGVEVDNVIMRNEKSSSSGASSSTQLKSIQRSSGIQINAHIEETWTNPRTKELHIWLVKD